ncbi:MAG TPA: tetratricopeptide repeat protein, partial [Planctomycetaceae bacterium]|nr:tetratricopeptide repeat protein [Planctomycetaceae bacterium]
AQRYRTQFPQGRQRFRALAITAVAHARLDHKTESEAAWNELLEKADSPSLITSTTLQLAELAEQRKDWMTAEGMYSRLSSVAKQTKDVESEVFGLRGLAWAQFQQKHFPEAAKTFAQVEHDFPQHRLAPECAYYHAEALREAGQLSDAATAFSAAFTRYAPQEPAAPGAEQQPPGLFAYRAGLQAARSHRQLQQVELADKAYAAVLEKFPKPQHLDKLLDEWALLNYEANRFEQADALFRRLLKETPESDLADNARLSLAESDLLADRLDQARVAFEELRKSPQADDTVRERAHYQLIILAMDQRRWDEVKALTAEFRQAFPASPLTGYVAYCAIEAQLGDPQATPEVIAAAEKQLRDQIDAPTPAEVPAWYPRLWVLLAEVRFRQKNYEGVDQAVAELKQKLPNGPLLYQADEVLGRSYKQQAQFEKAREAFNRAIADPTAFRTETAAKSQFLIAETYFLEEKWVEAFRAYMKVYASYATFPDWQSAALFQAGKCDEQQGQWKDAVQTYEQLLTEFPQSTHVAEARKRQENARKRIVN